ncbi:MAG: heme-binding protein [Mycobacterium sp.]|nr:heme-binding protein [Mycobacterium sp.]
MTRPAVRRSLFGTVATIGVASCAALMIPLASADPESEPAPAPADNCNASQLAKTVSGVTASLSDYFAAHPDVNQALRDITRQPAFVAVGQFDSYFGDHPDEANDLRAIQQPLVGYKNNCGMQVSPTDALTVLAEV